MKGDIDPATPTLVRMQLLSVFPDVFAEAGGRESLVRRSMENIAEEGSGVLVLINRPVPDFVSRAMRIAGSEAAEKTAGENPEQRDYGNGAQILAELGVRDMILLTLQLCSSAGFVNWRCDCRSGMFHRSKCEPAG